MSEVTICNLALSHLGDTATVASIKPPEDSMQAQHCARFYPAARNALLEMAAWGFATCRAALALLWDQQADGWVAPAGWVPQTWRYAYAQPAAVVNVLSVIPADAIDDYEAHLPPESPDHFIPFPQGYVPVPGALEYEPQPFALEVLADGTQVVLTNVPNAVLRYTTLVEDTTKFSPLFTLSLSYLLASMLAGPILKGDVGVTAAEQMLAMFGKFETKAETSDANQRKTNVAPAVGWIRGR